MNEIIEKVLKNSEDLYNKSIGTDNEYVKFDLTKKLIESYFNKSEIMKCIGVQPVVDGSDECCTYFYRKNNITNKNTDISLNSLLLNETYPTLSFNIVKNNTKCNIIRQYDLNIPESLLSELEITHGINPDKELEFIFEYEPLLDFDLYIKEQMIKIALDFGNVTNIDKEITIDELIDIINMESNKIAVKTVRGRANFCIAPLDICKKIVSIDKQEEPFCRVGIINDRIPLISDKWMSMCQDKYILLGYCGNKQSDCGMVFNPNTMFMVKKTANGLKCETTYGLSTDEQSGMYYHLIKLSKNLK